MGSLGVVTMGHQKGALEVRSTASFARVVCVAGALCVLCLGSTATAQCFGPRLPHAACCHKHAHMADFGHAVIGPKD